MKKWLTYTFCVFFCANAAIAQKIRFTDSSNVWTLKFSQTMGGSTDYKVGKRAYKDTVVVLNGYNYKVLGGINSITGAFHATTLIREDTFTNKVYAINLDFPEKYEDSNEYVLYDYNLQVGDTFKIDKYDTTNNIRYKVAGINSVSINGSLYKVFQMNGISNGTSISVMRIIEGIGCTKEPLFPFIGLYFEYDMNLVCFKNNGQYPLLSAQIGPFDNKLSCGDTAISVKSIYTDKSGVEIYPQPAQNVVYANLPYEIQQGSVYLCDLLGKVVLQYNFSKKNQLEIFNSRFIPGMYFYRITDSKKSSVFTGKVVFD